MKPLRNIAFLFSIGLMIAYGCYPNGPSTTDDYTIVKTQYNTAYDFGSKKTYYLPDSMMFQTNIDDDKIEWSKVKLYEATLLNAIEENMELRGYTLEKTDTNNMDLVVLPSAILYTNSGATWWPGGGWWGGYYPPGWGGGGWYYPPGYGGYWSYYSYTTGTVFITIADFDSYDSSDIRPTIEIEWDAAIDGLFEGVNTQKITPLVGQAFNQSPYLKSN